MNVRTIIGAHAYAVITHDNGTIDVLLEAGHSPEYSLAQAAREMREKAEQINRRAGIIEEAAGWLAAQKEIAK